MLVEGNRIKEAVRDRGIIGVADEGLAQKRRKARGGWG